MSVYTSVSQAQLDDFLLNYDVGKCLGYRGIEAGVENTNYFVSTRKGEFVLTLYEELTHQQLPFFLGLLDHLSAHQVATVTPVPRRDNSGFIGTLAGKPAALVERLPGTNVMDVTDKHCAIIGSTIARMHLAGQSYPGNSCRSGHRDEAFAQINNEKVFSQLSTDQQTLLRSELHYYAENTIDDMSKLPQGIIHADLFRDNCLFVQDEPPRLSGIIDFYYANRDALLYDLAIIANDWCFDKQGQLDMVKHQALLQAYHASRPLTDLEICHWSDMLRASALYFWVYRLLFNLFPRQGETVATKNAQEFQQKLEWHLQHLPEIQAVIDSLLEVV